MQKMLIMGSVCSTAILALSNIFDPTIVFLTQKIVKVACSGISKSIFIYSWMLLLLVGSVFE